jgi:hypothetical protein
LQEAAGATAAELIVSNPEECTVDNVLDHLSSSECMSTFHSCWSCFPVPVRVVHRFLRMFPLLLVIACDKMSGGASVAAMKADYERMLAAARCTCRSMSPRRRRTAAEMGSVPVHRALEEVRKPMGGTSLYCSLRLFWDSFNFRVLCYVPSLQLVLVQGKGRRVWR